MKRLILLIMVATFLTGCSCLFSQIPPQKIYAGSGCTALLPDYRTKIVATDNCEISSLTQVPSPGYVLSASNKIVNVTVKATDASGNFRQIVFSVTLLDTVKPVLTVDPSLLSYQNQQLKEIFDFADGMVMEIEKNFDNTFPFDSFPGLREKYKFGEYDKKMLVVSSMNNLTGGRSRLIAFADSIKVFNR